VLPTSASGPRTESLPTYPLCHDLSHTSPLSFLGNSHSGAAASKRILAGIFVPGQNASSFIRICSVHTLLVETLRDLYGAYNCGLFRPAYSTYSPGAARDGSISGCQAATRARALSLSKPPIPREPPPYVRICVRIPTAALLPKNEGLILPSLSA
jgi:hypothetical protein